MSKSKKEKQAIEQGNQDLRDYYSNQQKRKKKPIDPARPDLLKRIGSILIDSITIIGIIFLLQFVFTKTLAEPTGYNSFLNQINEINNNSGLYIENDLRFLTITETYDEEKTPEENYDVVISYFYKTNERAILDNKYESYCNSKLGSALYETDSNGDITRKKDISDIVARNFLSEQYTKAIKYLHSDSKYVEASNKSFAIHVISVMTCGIISMTIFYLVIPMLTKENETIGQKIFKLVVVTNPEKTRPTKKQIYIRYIVLLIGNVILPTAIYILSTTSAGIPLFVNLAVLCFNRDNTSFHDFFSKTKIINKSRSNAFEVLESMKEMTAEQAQNTPNYYNDK